MRYFFNPRYPAATVLADGEPALRVLQTAPEKIVKKWSANMSNVISLEVIEELRRQKAGPAPAPAVGRETAQFKPNAPDEISRLIAALIMNIQQDQPSDQPEVGAA
jgi:hypothetical protein